MNKEMQLDFDSVTVAFQKSLTTYIFVFVKTAKFTKNVMNIKIPHAILG